MDSQDLGDFFERDSGSEYPPPRNENQLNDHDQELIQMEDLFERDSGSVYPPPRNENQLNDHDQELIQMEDLFERDSGSVYPPPRNENQLNDHDQEVIQMEDLFERDDKPFEESGSEYLPSRNASPASLNLLDYFQDENIYIPDDWLAVIKAARNKNSFNIVTMNKKHFFSTKKLETNITNRKVTAERSKVMWLKMQWLKFHKIHQFKIFFKYSNNTDVLFESVDVSKRNSKSLAGIELDLLYPDGKEIRTAGVCATSAS